MGKNIAIVGATGAVGQEIMSVLEKRNFPINTLTLLASAGSAGTYMRFKGEKLCVQELTKNNFEGIDIALFSAGGSISKEFAPHAAKAGCIVVDNSSAFRMDQKASLIVPEINAFDIRGHNGIISNPNCTTIITLLAVFPLHQAFGVRRITASSYQAVSGSGAAGIKELDRQTRQIAEKSDVTTDIYPHQIAANLLPLIGEVTVNGHTDEEMKMCNEGRKIMNHPTFGANVTCVRVPVARAHTVSVTIEAEQSLSLEAAIAVLENASGIDVVDDPAKLLYPMPLVQSGKDKCAVGRIRMDPDCDDRLSFVVCGDQVLKGAALNAVQIAELL